MQFPVPQFTDVEDKIIGSLTVKQFGILFGAGVIIFLAYSTTKSLLVGVFFFVLFGLPALAVAFAKINGRPMYSSFGFFAKYLMSPKILIFHKEAPGLSGAVKLKDAELAAKTAGAAKQEPVDPRTRLKQINELLAKQASEEAELAEKIRK